MATTIARLEAKLVADTHNFDRGMDKSETKMHKVGKVAGVAGLAIAGGLAYGLDKSVKAAMDAQVSQARLEQAFRSSGLSAARNAKQVSTLEKAGRRLGFTDEQTKDALGSLLIATHSMSKASRDLSVAQDIARFKHVDLTQASKMLTMAMAGSQRATKQLGLSVQASTANADKAKLAYRAQKDALDAQFPSVSKMTQAQKDQLVAMKDNLDQQYAGTKAAAQFADKQVTAGKVIDLVSTKLHGQSSAYAQTAAGSMEQFRAQLTHLEVSLGSALLPAMAQTAGALAKLTDFFSRHATATRVLIVATAALGVAFLTTSVYAKLMSSALVTKLIPALARTTVGQVLLNVATAAFPAVAIILALAAVGIALVIAYKKVTFFREGVQATFNWVKQNWPLLVGIIGGPIGIALEQIITKRNRIAAAFRELPGMIGNAIGGAIGVLKNKLEEIFDWHRIVRWIEHALGFSEHSEFFGEIGHKIVRSMARGVGEYSGVLKDAVFRLAKEYTVGLGGRALGAIPGAKGTIVGEGTGSGIHASPDVAKQFAVTQLRNYGWGPSEMAPLYKLWNQESGWRWNARNASSGAYGIPQSYPASKMASAGADWRDNAFTQIRWGLGYIKSVYGSPSRAWAQDVAGGLKGYDKGGWLPPGLSLAMNATGRPERVLPPGQSGGNTYNFSFPNYVGDESVVAAVVRDAMESFQNRNGRGGF